jgi:glycogen operon protein
MTSSVLTAVDRQLDLEEGNPHPRGATWDGKGTNFAVFSEHATKVEVCLFDEDGKEEL